MIIWEEHNFMGRIEKDIICNKCGNSCKVMFKQENDNLGSCNIEVFEFLEINNTWGYFSEELDGEHWNFHLCKRCSLELFNSLEIKEGVVRSLI